MIRHVTRTSLTWWAARQLGRTALAWAWLIADRTRAALDVLLDYADDEQRRGA